MKPQERDDIFAQRLEEESGNDESCFWMSFCDTERPKGDQFLGVVIMKSVGFAHAVQRAWALGINPGGQIKSIETDPTNIALEHFDVLLSKSDLIAAGYIGA